MRNNSLKVTEIVARGYINPSKLPGYDYVVNPYVGCPHRCIYCYAEFMKRFSNHDEPWGTFTDVKVRSLAVRPVPLANKKVFLSSVTDCYNPLEAKYTLTRKLLGQLAKSGGEVTILTKSNLVERDADILAQCPHATVGISLHTLDENFLHLTEPGASSGQARLNALQTLHKNGVRTWIHMAPLWPYISDWKGVLETAGGFTDLFSFENLKLRAAALPRVMAFIARYYPQLKEPYEQIYRGNNGADYWRALRKEILAYCNDRHLSAAVHFKETQ